MGKKITFTLFAIVITVIFSGQSTAQDTQQMYCPGECAPAGELMVHEGVLKECKKIEKDGQCTTKLVPVKMTEVNLQCNLTHGGYGITLDNECTPPFTAVFKDGRVKTVKNMVECNGTCETTGEFGKTKNGLWKCVVKIDKNGVCSRSWKKILDLNTKCFGNCGPKPKQP